MKKILFAMAFAILASTQAFAIVGVGAHYVMNTGKLDAKYSSIPISTEIDLGNIGVDQKAAEGLNGIGFKAWIDFLPFIDIEGTLNVAAASYSTYLIIPGADEPINLGYTPEAPFSMVFSEAKPLFGVVNGDLSITYPFTDLPIIRPYIGAGVSYFASIPIVNASMIPTDYINELKALAEDPTNVNPDQAQKTQNAIKDYLIGKLKDDYTTGIGGHIIAGLRAKLPIIPLAIYANGKYYFGGNTNSQFSQGFVLEAGGGFAL